MALRPGNPVVSFPQIRCSLCCCIRPTVSVLDHPTLGHLHLCAACSQCWLQIRVGAQIDRDSLPLFCATVRQSATILQQAFLRTEVAYPPIPPGFFALDHRTPPPCHYLGVPHLNFTYCPSEVREIQRTVHWPPPWTTAAWPLVQQTPRRESPSDDVDATQGYWPAGQQRRSEPYGGQPAGSNPRADESRIWYP